MEKDNFTCLFDLNKLEFRDIMKEDYHPSLNFAEIAERSLIFLEKNLVRTEIENNRSIFERLITQIERFHMRGRDVRGYFIYLLVALNLAIIIV